MKKTALLARQPLFCLAVLSLGLAAMAVLAGMKQAPARQKVRPRPLAVRVIPVAPGPVRIWVTGYGSLVNQAVSRIAPQVPGQVVRVMPGLKKGARVKAGEILFRIDPKTYELALEAALARHGESRAQVHALEKQANLDLARKKTVSRSRDLARARFHRLARLYEKALVSQSDLDQAEIELNRFSRDLDLLDRELALYPDRIARASWQARALAAAADQARLDLDRCQVAAPFNGRIQAVSIAAGSFLSAQVPVVSLARENHLEIQVCLQAQDLFAAFGSSPFDALAGAACEISWVEQKNCPFAGQVARVAEYDPTTRSVRVTIALETAGQDNHLPGDDPEGRACGFIPMAGMFCTVRIRGRQLASAARIPETALVRENTVFIVAGGRLRMTRVDIGCQQGEMAFVTAGLEPGDLLAVSPLSPSDQGREVVISKEAP